MKKYNLLVLMCFALTLVFAQSKDEKPYLVKNFSKEKIEKLQVSTSGGGIKVAGTDSKEAQVRVFVRKNNNYYVQGDKEIEDELNRYIIDVGFSEGTIVCSAKPREPKSGNYRLSIGFEVDVPKNIDTDLHTSGGGITMKNLNGNLKFKTSGGGLKLAGLSGKVEGKTSGGGIDVIDSEGNINLNTSGGGIDASNCKGDIYLNTSGGGIDLKNLKGNIVAYTSGGGIDVETVKGSLDVKTSGGGIDLNNVAGDISAKTSGGGIDAKITKIGEYLHLSTSAGNINVDLPFNQGMDLDLSARKIKSTKLAKVSNNLESGKVKGKVNGGGAEVKITTSVGSIIVD